MQKLISSLHNPGIKKLLQLQEKSRVRRKEKCFVIEGAREIRLALKGGFKINEIFICPELFTSPETTALLESLEAEIFRSEVSREIYAKIAYRGSTEGIIAVAQEKDISLSTLEIKQKDPLILIAEAPEKPGNIGALLRTADAAGLDAVIIANPKTDLFNPNIIRSSLGCVFTTPVATGTNSDIIDFLKKREIPIFAAALQASQLYSTVDFTGACAIVVGTEATGLSTQWLSSSSQNIIIPMHGEIDSMNVSVAAGILIFEAKRQRNLK